MATDTEARALDAEVAVAVMGWGWQASCDGGGRWLAPPEHRGDFGREVPAIGNEPLEEPWWLFDEDAPWHVPNYSTDIAPAWEVVEEMATKGFRLSLEWNLAEDGTRWWHAEFDDGSTAAWVEDKDAPLAICRATLAALDKGEG